MSNNYRPRYPGAASFQDTDKDIFFGRDRERQEVLNLLLTQKMLTLFAESGLGKTSLLNAGVIPEMDRHNLYPIPVRFGNANQDAVEQFCAHYQEKYDHFYAAWGNRPFVEHRRRDGKLLLWQTLHNNPLVGFTPVFILDQFEEFFRTYPVRAHRSDFMRQIAQLLSDYVPSTAEEGSQNKISSWSNHNKSKNSITAPLQPLDLRVVFSIRADELVRMQEVSEYLPFILRLRYELRPLSEKEARGVIEKPGQLTRKDGFPTRQLHFDKDTLTGEESILEGAKDELTGQISTFQLQIVCRHLENRFSPSGSTAYDAPYLIKATDYKGKAGIREINKTYINDSIDEIVRTTHGLKSGTVWDELAELVNESGHRKLKAADELRLLNKSTLKALVEKRILKQETLLKIDYYEISHDKLAYAFLEAKQNKALRVERKKARNAYIIAAIVLAFAGVLLYLMIKVNNLNSTLESQKTVLKADSTELTTRYARIKKDSSRLVYKNLQITGQKNIIYASSNKIQRTALFNFWQEFELVKSMMKGRLFIQANSQLISLLNGIYKQKKLNTVDSLQKGYLILEKRVNEAKLLAHIMSPVERKVRRGECFLKQYDISCAAKEYRYADDEQKNIRKKHKYYKAYVYTSLSEMADNLLAIDVDTKIKLDNLDKKSIGDQCICTRNR